MKSVMKFNTYLAITALILTAALVVPAAAQKQVPFKGSIQAQETDTPSVPPGTLSAAGSGTGIGTQVGQFSLSYDLTVTLANGTAAGSGHWIAANGDTIDTTITGSSVPTATPDVFSIREIYIVTGGTGRFEGAQGSFIVERLINLATGVTSGSFHGTITSPGSADAEDDEN
jgi:hypothetical protein